MTSVPLEAVGTYKRPSRLSFLLERGMIPVWLGVGVLVAFTVAGFVADLPFNPTAPDANSPLIGPSGDHWFGTDLSGFDVFSRVIVERADDEHTGPVQSCTVTLAPPIVASLADNHFTCLNYFLL